jgi:hypothetical protein
MPEPAISNWTERMEAFVAESNRIEGIARPVTNGEREAHKRLWASEYLKVGEVEHFVADICGAPLRRSPAQNVRVGGHLPPRGGPQIERELQYVLDAINDALMTPYEVHVAYETLHPFMDGNGRSGRALWAWQMRRYAEDPFSLGFLHSFYYQSLSGARRA